MQAGMFLGDGREAADETGRGSKKGGGAFATAVTGVLSRGHSIGRRR